MLTKINSFYPQNLFFGTKKVSNSFSMPSFQGVSNAPECDTFEHSGNYEIVKNLQGEFLKVKFDEDSFEEGENEDLKKPILRAAKSCNSLFEKVLLEENYLRIFSLKTPYDLSRDANLILDRFKTFGKEEYEDLNKKEKSILRDEIPKVSPECFAGFNAKNLITISKDIKSKLDDIYGEGKYVFVSLGQSPRWYSYILEQLGVQTINVNTSDAKNMKYFKKSEHYKEYKKYLQMAGLNKKNVTNSDKTFIIADYTFGGRSLRSFCDYLKSPFGLGLGYENVKKLSINDLFLEGATGKEKEKKEELVEEYMLYGSDKYFSLGHKLYHFDLVKLEKIANFPYKNESKLVQFAILEELKRQGDI